MSKFLIFLHFQLRLVFLVNFLGLVLKIETLKSIIENFVVLKLGNCEFNEFKFQLWMFGFQLILKMSFWLHLRFGVACMWALGWNVNARLVLVNIVLSLGTRITLKIGFRSWVWSFKYIQVSEFIFNRLIQPFHLSCFNLFPKEVHYNVHYYYSSYSNYSNISHACIKFVSHFGIIWGRLFQLKVKLH